MRFELVNVTPPMAAAMLAKNEGNRKLREQHAATLARAMDSGKYKVTHQAVAITKKGRLIDGQHRMRAIVLCGKTLPIWIAYEVPDDIYAVLDSGLVRKMHERLRSNSQHTTICTSLFRLMVRTSRAQEYEIQAMLDVLSLAFEKYSAIPHNKNKKGLRAAHIAAVVMWLAVYLKRGDDDAICRVQWLAEKLGRGDLVGAPPVMHSFYRQLSEGVANLDLGVAPITDQFCRSWRAFDPANEAVTKLQVSDQASDLRAARLEFKFISEGIFD